MNLGEGNFIRATVNGKKAGFVVFNGNIWLLSDIVAWDRPTTPYYNDVPRHSFHRKQIVWFGLEEMGTGNRLSTFEAWRDYVLSRPGHIAAFMVTIAFLGEQGFELEIRRRNRRSDASEDAATSTDAETTATHAVLTERGADVDFYLDNYKTDNIYQGIHSYHNSHSSGYMNRPSVPFSGHRIGIELEVEANNSDFYHEIVNKKSNWFTREHDSTLGVYGIEFITVPLLPADAKSYAVWQPLCQYLKDKATSWDTNRCGLHVHIGREILGTTEAEQQMTLGKLLIFYQGDVEDWVKATAVFGRSSCYHQPNGTTEELKAVKLLGKSVMKDPDVYAKVDTAMRNKFSTSRYFAINLMNRATVEFRKGRGSINADRIIAVITMVEAICLYCKATQPHDLSLESFKQFLWNNVPCGNPVYRYLNITQPDM